MRKILPVLMIGVALASAVDASALTARDLDGKYYGAYMIGTDLEYELAKEQFGGKFELRNGTLYISGGHLTCLSRLMKTVIPSPYR